MTQQLPAEIAARIATWFEASGPSNRAGAEALSKAYKQGANSSTISLAAYLTTRLPATFAAISAVLERVQEVLPDFAPDSLLDIGAGPGTASFAAQAAWPSLKSITMIDADGRFAQLAQQLSPQAQVLHQPLQNLRQTANVVLAAYVFAELPESQAAAIATRLWSATQSLLIIIEPGTPHGFARIRTARASLIKESAHIIGPCTHAQICPMVNNDWCHFKTRLARSRAHMQAKHAVVPFEDESFSWIAVARQATPLPKARILAPPQLSKVAVSFKLCAEGGLSETAIASRNKPAYKLAKKKKWGDSFDV